MGGVRDALRLHEEYQLKLEALRHDVQIDASSIRAGRISRATLEEIIEKAKASRNDAFNRLEKPQNTGCCDRRNSVKFARIRV